MDWREYNHWQNQDCVNIALTHSHKYYNYVRAYNQALNSRSTNKTSDGSRQHIFGCYIKMLHCTAVSAYLIRIIIH